MACRGPACLSVADHGAELCLWHTENSEGLGHCPRTDMGHRQSVWRWERLDTQKYEGFGVSGRQRKQQKAPSMRPRHPPLRRSMLESSVPVSDLVADAQ